MSETRVLKATLPAGATYVSGRVNGTETTWTNVQGNEWETVAARSPDDRYKVELSIVSESGATSEANFTLFYGLHLITDRTAEDIKNGTEKGRYTAEDLNRVNSAIAFLRDKLTAAGYNPNVKVKADWTDAGWASDASAADYLESLRSLREQMNLPAGTPYAPDRLFSSYLGKKDGLTWQKANEIEIMLEILDAHLEKSKSIYVYSGEIYSGEE